MNNNNEKEINNKYDDLIVKEENKTKSKITKLEEECNERVKDLITNKMIYKIIKLKIKLK